MSDLSVFVAEWLERQEEHSLSDVLAWQNTTLNVRQLKSCWDVCISEQFIRQSPSGKFGLTPDGVNCLDDIRELPRISLQDAQKITDHAVEKINAWGHWAASKGYPTIAFAAVWGSSANSMSTSCGDVDLALVWRRPIECVGDIPDPPSILLNVIQQLSSNPSVWEIEDKVEEWLSAPYVNVSGVDQWDELQPTHVKIVYQDQFWDQNHSSIKDHERTAVTRWCPKKSTRVLK